MFVTSLPESLEGDGESATVRGGDSPRLKKRRLFNGPQATFSSVIGDAPPPVQQMLQPLKVRTLENSFDLIKRVSPKIAAFFSWDWILLQQWWLILHTFCWFCSSLKILSGMMKIDTGFWAPCQQSGMQAMVITYLISSLTLIIELKTFLDWLVHLYPFVSWIYDGHCNLITMPSATTLLTVYDCMWWLYQMTVNCLQETIIILWSQCQKIGSLRVLKKMTALFCTVTTSKQAQIWLHK